MCDGKDLCLMALGADARLLSLLLKAGMILQC